MPPFDLDKLIRAVQQIPEQVASQVQRGRKSAPVDLDAIIGSVTAGRQTRTPPASWDEALQREARSKDPRPSRVLHAYLESLSPKNRAKVLADRGVWLQRARESLSNQPPRAVTRPRSKRLSGVEPMTILDAFAGGGLLNLAMHIEGARTVDLCEINKWAVETLNANRHRWYGIGIEAVSCDARDWEPRRSPGNVDLLTGGPPCKPFSKGAEMHRRVELGPTAPDNFFPRVLDWVCDVQPRVVALENSSRIVEDARFREWFEVAWVPQMEALGYRVAFWNLSAADFGTPQNRKRAWVVAWPKGAPWGKVLRHPPQPTHGRPGTSGVGEHGLLPWVPGFDRLTSGCCQGFYLVDCVNLGDNEVKCRGCIDARNFEAAPNTVEPYGRIALDKKMVGRGGTRARSFADWMMEEYSELRPGERRIDWKNPADMAGAWAWRQLEPHARTVTQYLAHVVVPKFATMPDGLIVPPGLDAFGSVDREDDRALKSMISQFQLMGVRDAAKLQDVPQWYAFEGPRSACFTQIGMGIPVNMGRAVARHIRSALGIRLVDHQAEPPIGLWPVDRLDPCAGFVGLDESTGWPLGEDEAAEQWQFYSESGAFDALTEQERRARPYLAPQAYQPPGERGLGRRREAGERMRQIWVESGYGYNVIDAKKLHDLGWRPASAYNTPPGMEDDEDMVDFFQARIAGVGELGFEGRPPELGERNHWGLVYRAAFPKADYRALWPLEVSEGLPSWSSFTQNDLRRAARRESQ